MSKKGDLMRVGDLVITHKAYNPTQHYICKIIDIIDNTVIIGGDNINCFYTIFAERKDVDKLEVEYK